MEKKEGKGQYGKGVTLTLIFAGTLLQISTHAISINTLIRLIADGCRIGLWGGDARPLTDDARSAEKLERRLEVLASLLMSSCPIVLDLIGRESEDRKERG